MSTPTRLRSFECFGHSIGTHATKIFKILDDTNKYDKTTLIPALHL